MFFNVHQVTSLSVYMANVILYDCGKQYKLQYNHFSIGALPRYGMKTKQGSSYDIRPVMSQVQCVGNETNINQCGANRLVPVNCTTYAGVQCYGKRVRYCRVNFVC